MDRRKFIKNSSLAAAFLGLSPAFPAFTDHPGVKKKKLIFVFRGVAYADAFRSFQKFNLNSGTGFHIQKVQCTNASYSHTEGLKNLVENLKLKKYEVVCTQTLERHTIPQVVEDAFAQESKQTKIIYLHHSEIGHSSIQMYIEALEKFFTELNKYYKETLHEVIVTADIGRNATLNSCGGRDHSNPSCLETFALYLGEHAPKLAENTETLDIKKVLTLRF